MKIILALMLVASLADACWVACTSDENKADSLASVCRSAKAALVWEQMDTHFKGRGPSEHKVRLKNLQDSVDTKCTRR